jgi:hypothetical protein
MTFNFSLNNISFPINKIVKYIVYICIVYALMKIIPSTKINDSDMLLIIIIITLCLILLDTFNSKEGFESMLPPGFQQAVSFDSLLQTTSQPTINMPQTTSQSTMNMPQSTSQPTMNNMSQSTSQSTSQTTTQPTMSMPQTTSQPTINNMPQTTSQPTINNMPQSTSQPTMSNMPQSTSQPTMNNTPQLSCGPAINELKMKMNNDLQLLQNKISELQTMSPDKNTKKYMESLINDLLEKHILDQLDISNIYAKIDSKLISMDDVIAGLENLKLTGKAKNKEGQPTNDFVYSELPAESYKPLADKSLDKWDNEFSLLNTNRWEVPMPRPPVCINTSPCKVCPDVAEGYPLNVKEWDNSRKISNTNINKDWANNMIDVKTNVLSNKPSESFKSLSFEQVLGRRN